MEEIEPEILYCPYDQTYDEGMVWIFGSRTSLEEVLQEHGVPEALREEVAVSMHCNGCGAQLDRWSDVGLAHDFELEHDRRIEAAAKRYEEPLAEFQQHLQEYPYLGLDHRVGKRIVHEVQSFPAHELDGGRWYRARRLESGRVPSVGEMVPRDPHQFLVPGGRYNHAGQAFWYLASSPEAAAAEAVGPGEEMAWVQEFKIPDPVRVLDVRAWEADDERFLDEEGEPREVPLAAVALVHSDTLVEWVARGRPSETAYHVPRFVADAARRARFDGVIFRSPRHLDDNLVLFDRARILVPQGAPKIIRLPAHLLEAQEHGLFYTRGHAVLLPRMPLRPIPKERDAGDDE